MEPVLFFIAMFGIGFIKVGITYNYIKKIVIGAILTLGSVVYFLYLLSLPLVPTEKDVFKVQSFTPTNATCTIAFNKSKEVTVTKYEAGKGSGRIKYVYEINDIE